MWVAEQRPYETEVRLIVTESTGKRVALARCPACTLPVRVAEENLGQLLMCKACDFEFVVRPQQRMAVTVVPPKKGA
jgi:hypothetical protein